MILNLKPRKTAKTEMVNWRGGQMEFATETRFTAICRPPWYIIKLTDETWVSPWYYWIDYLGVPQIFLTKTMANRIASQLRKQYKCKVEVEEVEIKRNT